MNQSENHTVSGRYCGRILNQPCSETLKKRLLEYIHTYRSIDNSPNPAMLYVAAWDIDQNDIWYEYISRRILTLLQCPSEQVAQTIMQNLVDRHVYTCSDTQAAIQHQVSDQSQFLSERRQLRAESKDRGFMDAVYKLELRSRGTIWLKDLASVETYDEDNICLSLGSLIIVTKEMRAEQEQLERQRLQVALEMAGAVCHELNQPIQGIFGYAEMLSHNRQLLKEDREKIEKILEHAKRMARITKKMMHITTYETKDYLKGVKIADLEKSSKKKPIS